nr:ATP-binding cassette domain-containing protein [Kineosphaera limosa]
MADVTFDERDVQVRLDVAGGEVVALLGRNGAGKSTLLQAISGLSVPDEGRVVVGGQTFVDTAAGIFRPAHTRGLGVLTQDPLLFPHLSVAANVAFGPRSRGRGRRAAHTSALRWLDALGVADLAARRPGQLSGGQAQRVGLARALAVEPAVLLLDEPLAALDIAVAAQLRPLLRQICREQGRTTLIVTHDLLDVLALADRIAVIEGGRIVEVGTTTQVLAAPRSAFAARLAGVNLVPGLADAGPAVRTADGGRVVGVGDVPDGQHAVAVFAPSAVSVFPEPPTGSPRNIWPAVVTELAPAVAGDGAVHLRARVEGVGLIAADVTPAAAAELRLEPGAAVYLAVKAQEVAIHART